MAFKLEGDVLTSLTHSMHGTSDVSSLVEPPVGGSELKTAEKQCVRATKRIAKLKKKPVRKPKKRAKGKVVPQKKKRKKAPVVQVKRDAKRKSNVKKRKYETDSDTDTCSDSDTTSCTSDSSSNASSDSVSD